MMLPLVFGVPKITAPVLPDLPKVSELMVLPNCM